MQIIEGNIMDITEGVIVHQVNNKRVMGAGLAKQIRAKYPRHYEDYMVSSLTMGTLIVTEYSNTFSVVGMVAQDGYGRNRRYTSYRSFIICLSGLSSFHKMYPDVPIYMPYGIGCGLAGGSWNVIEDILEEHAPFITLVKLKGSGIIMKILECSSKGDKRFSAFYARVDVNGRTDSIENHYQLCKRFGHDVPKTWRDSKGKRPTHFEVSGKGFAVQHLTSFYKLLWCAYLDRHPELVEHAKQFDQFNDMFKGKSVNCQADVIKQYVQQGRKSIIEECSEFIKIMKGGE